MAQQKLLNKDGFPCPYCHRTMDIFDMKLQPTSDHVKPKSRFVKLRGGRVNGRTIVVCSECNFMKSDLSLSEFVSSLEEKNKILLKAIETNEERIRNISYLLQIGLDKE